MNQFISFLKSWYYSKTKIPFGILLISIYMVFTAVYGSVKSIDSMEAFKNQSIHNIIILFGMFISGIGLTLNKGWAWNFTVAIYSFLLLTGFLSVLQNFFFYKHVGNYPALIIGIIIHLIFQAPVLAYLLLKKVRHLYPKSPISLFIMGFYLMSFSWANQNNSMPFLIQSILMIIGIALTGMAARNLRGKV